MLESFAAWSFLSPLLVLAIFMYVMMFRGLL